MVSWLELMLIFYTVVVSDILCFSVSIMIMGKKSGFSWKLIVVYGSPYEEGKQAF